jgi:hypothetical protein
MPSDYVASLNRLTTVRFDSIFCGTMESFLQYPISLEQNVVHEKDYVQFGLTRVVWFLAANEFGKVIIFTNSHDMKMKCQSALEAKLDAAKIESDVIRIDWKLHMLEKFWFAWLFCSPCYGLFFVDFCTLIALMQ